MILLQTQEKLWNAYQDPQQILQAHRLDQVIPLMQQLEDLVEGRGLFAAGYVAYEAAAAFDGALKTHPAQEGRPLAWFALFREFLQAPLDHFIKESPLPMLQNDLWSPLIQRDEYNRAIDRVHEYLKRGDSYQVNYTMPLKGPGLEPSMGDPKALFQALMHSAQGSLGAYLDTGDEQILSLSPELFFHQQGDRISCRPMKGTAPRGNSPAEDQQLKEELLHSQKNRAENLMILDMIRNDLGHIARPGSVQVDELFSLESYPTVHQMVSQASCLTQAGLTDIFRALFPCSSITGAPKVRTMEIIKELEPHPRGIYTGAIGYLHPGRNRRFNVAIRTLVNRREESRYHVGGGIVWDSRKDDEYREALLKSRVVNRPLPDFELLETLLWTPARGFWLLKEHLDRLEWSAPFFGFPLNRRALEKELGLQFFDEPRRIRLTLNRRGQWNWTHQAAASPGSGSPEAIPPKLPMPRFMLSEKPVDSRNRLLYHKTTARQIYQERTLAEADFTLLHNQRGECTEFTIGNLVIRKGGLWLTPPVSCGLLPGVFRRVLLEKGEIQEAHIRLEDLESAEEIFLINSVRGWVKVQSN